MSGNDDISALWAALGQMHRVDLRIAWMEAFNEAAPHYLSMIFMRKALIWHEQCRAFGGMGTDLRRALKASVEGRPNCTEFAAAPRPGTQLVREWNGRRYLVEVTDDGWPNRLA